MRGRASVAWALLALAIGCGGDEREGGTGGPAGMGDGGGSTTDGGGGSADAGTTRPDSGTAEGAVGRLEGVVRRTAEPRAGGVGHLYIAVFDLDPVLNRADAMVIARTLVEDADLSADGATVPYSVEDIPPRDDPYFVTAFLDDDGDAGTDPATAGPDMGDLVSLNGLGSPQVTVDEPATVAFDVVLNANLPF